MKIISVVGARPNFMKIAPFIQAIKQYTENLTERGQSPFVGGKFAEGEQGEDEFITWAVDQLRGLGLMIGVELTIETKVLVPKLAANGLLVIPAGTNVIRFLPPLNVTVTEIDEAITKLEQTLNELGN